MAGAEASRGGAERVDVVLSALARYRERRALDGAETSGAECLLERVPRVEHLAERHRRRIELIERAVHEGWISAEEAAEVYDVAREEGLEPAFAFELVRCGVAVCEPEEVPPEAPEVLKGQPEWLESPVRPGAAVRERRLRMSFRRLRGLLERYGTPEEALTAFAQEPDVDTCGY
ncbi:MAG TPA: hypothetical protein VF188_15880 [Longimicrobiales bacterium]